jgi:hypothetical protein
MIKDCLVIRLMKPPVDTDTWNAITGWATLIGFVLSPVLWFFGPVKLKVLLHEHRNAFWVVCIALLIVGTYTLGWLSVGVYFPVWAFILIILGAGTIPIGVLYILDRIHEQKNAPKLPEYFDCHGVSWLITPSGLAEIPLCPEHRSEMYKETFDKPPDLWTFYERWRCRECHRKSDEWSKINPGSLHQDSLARFRGQIRRELSNTTGPAKLSKK